MISLPFDSENVGYDEQGYPMYDRASNSEQLRTMLSKNFTNGVYPNPSTQFQVLTGTDMTVTVNPGACNIQGAFAYETTNRVLIVQAADTTYDRIDRVVLRLNTNTSYRNIDLYVVEGTPASTPVAPALSRTSGIWEIGLANLFIAKNTTSISSSRITDTRLDKDVCGVVSGTIQSVDTSTIFAQYQAALDEYLELVERAISDTEAGYLQNQIDDLAGDLAEVYDTNKTYAVGDYCIYNGKLYRCTTSITTAEAWTSSHWTLTDCGNELKELNSNLDDANTNIANLSSLSIGTLTPNYVCINSALSNLGKCYKYGNMVIVKAWFNGAYFTSGTTLFTIPVGYRPTKNTNGVIKCRRHSETEPNGLISGNVIANPGGQIFEGFNSDGTANLWIGEITIVYSVE